MLEKRRQLEKESETIDWETCLSPFVANLWFVDTKKLSSESLKIENLITKRGTLNWEVFSYEKYRVNLLESEELSKIQHWSLEKQPAIEFVQKQVFELDKFLDAMSLEKFEETYLLQIEKFDPYQSKFLLRAFEMYKRGMYVPSAALISSNLEMMLKLSLHCSLDNFKIPRRMSQLLEKKEVINSVLGENVVFWFSSFFGPPPGFNLRNCVWHGFVADKNYNKQWTSFGLLLALSVAEYVVEKNGSSLTKNEMASFPISQKFLKAQVDIDYESFSKNIESKTFSSFFPFYLFLLKSL